MNRFMISGKGFLAPFPLRRSLVLRSNPSSSRLYTSSINSITQTSFWTSLIPKPLRNRSKPKGPSKSKSKEWNPATFFIVTFLLIGSMAIQMIALKNTHVAFERRAAAKIGLLKEIIERIQKGENVDVEGLLGTGDPKREKEWEEVLQEIEREDQIWEDTQQRRHPSRQANNSLRGSEAPKTSWQSMNVEEEKTEPEKPRRIGPRGFY